MRPLQSYITSYWKKNPLSNFSAHQQQISRPKNVGGHFVRQFVTWLMACEMYSRSTQPVRFWDIVTNAWSLYICYSAKNGAKVVHYAYLG